MNIQQLIKKRRSVYPKQFNGKIIEDAYILDVLESAQWAPTHHLTQPWQFVVFKEEAKNRLLDQLAYLYSEHTPADSFSEHKYHKFNDRKRQVSHIIAIVMRRHEETGIPEEEEIAAVAMAVQNIWLSLAETEDIGGYWSSGKLIGLPSFAEYLHLREDERCLGLFYLGRYDADSLPNNRKREPLQDHMRWEK